MSYGNRPAERGCNGTERSDVAAERCCSGCHLAPVATAWASMRNAAAELLKQLDDELSQAEQASECVRSLLRDCVARNAVATERNGAMLQRCAPQALELADRAWARKDIAMITSSRKWH